MKGLDHDEFKELRLADGASDPDGPYTIDDPHRSEVCERLKRRGLIMEVEVFVGYTETDEIVDVYWRRTALGELALRVCSFKMSSL